MVRGACVLIAGALGCGRFGFDPGPADAPGAVDAASIDARIGPDAALGPWSAPIHLPGLSTDGDDWGPAISPDGLTLYFHASRDDDSGDIFRATRATRQDAFGPPAPVAELNTGSTESNPALARDGTRMYLSSSRGGTEQLYVADLDGATFTVPVVIPELGDLVGAVVTDDELELFYNRPIVGGVLRAVRATTADPWTPLGPVPELADSLSVDGFPTLTSDALTIYFESDRGSPDTWIYTATRAARDAPFSVPVPFDPTTAPDSDSSDPDLSRDGRELFFASDRLGTLGLADLYVLTRGQ